MSTKVISLNEVAQHKSKNDLWLVIHNKVYDITSFVVEVSLITVYVWTISINMVAYEQIASWW